MPCPGSPLPLEQLISLAQGAGFSGNDLITAVALSLAESGGNPNCYNPEQSAGAPPNQGSYGLWQIYLYKHQQFDPGQLLDPAYNASAAYQVYQQAGYSFRPWTTYGSGAYLGFTGLVQASIAGQAPGSSGPGPVDSGGGGGGNGNGGDGSSSPPADYTPLILAGVGLLALTLYLQG